MKYTVYMKVAILHILLFFLLFDLSADDINLGLVAHLGIDSAESYEHIYHEGILSFFDGGYIWGFDSHNPANSYSDVYRSTYGINPDPLIENAFSSDFVRNLWPPATQYIRNRLEVYVYQGEIIGRSELIDLLGISDYDEKLKKNNDASFYEGVGTVFGIGGMLTLGTSFFIMLIDRGISDLVGAEYDDAPFLIAMGIGAGMSIGGLFIYGHGHSIRNEYPLWDYEIIRQKISDYNSALLLNSSN